VQHRHRFECDVKAGAKVCQKIRHDNIIVTINGPQTVAKRVDLFRGRSKDDFYVAQFL